MNILHYACIKYMVCDFSLSSRRRMSPSFLKSWRWAAWYVTNEMRLYIINVAARKVLIDTMRSYMPSLFDLYKKMLPGECECDHKYHHYISLKCGSYQYRHLSVLLDGNAEDKRQRSIVGNIVSTIIFYTYCQHWYFQTCFCLYVIYHFTLS